MKSNLLTKLLIALCLCLITALTFTACKEQEIYANNSDFESYPEYWNSFNENTADDNGDIFISDPDSNTSTNSSGSASASGTDSSDDISSDDFTANFIDDEELESNTSSEPDTDNDGITDDNDTDDDNDGITDDKDEDDDGDGTPDTEENNYGNQGPLYFFN